MLVEGGNAVLFFILCFFVSCPASFALFFRSSILRVAVRKIFRERTFVFGCRCWSCVVLVGFCLCFCFMFWRLAPENVWKNSLDVRSCFLGGLFSLLWVFIVDAVFVFLFCFFSRDIAQVVTGHPHTHLLSCSFSLFVSRRTCCFALFGRASCFSAFSSGCHSGPRAFLGFSLNPSEAFFLGREAARVFLCFSCPCFSFPPFVLFCGYTFSRRPSR